MSKFLDKLKNTLGRWGWTIAGRKIAVGVGGFAVGKVVAFLSSDAAVAFLTKLQTFGINITLDPDKINSGLTALVLAGVVMIDDFIRLHKDTNPPSPPFK